MLFEPKEVADRILTWARFNEPGMAARYGQAAGEVKRDVLRDILAAYLKNRPAEIATLPESLWIKLGWRKVTINDREIEACAEYLPGCVVRTFAETEELKKRYPWIMEPGMN